MERLTIPDVIVDENTTRRTIIDASEVRKHAMEFYWRLKSVEDILGDEYDLDRLRELAQADREGKIPRYAIGDTVYDRYGEPWQVVSAEVHSMHTKNEWLYRCGHEGTDDYCALWHFEAFPGREAALRRERDGY